MASRRQPWKVYHEGELELWCSVRHRCVDILRLTWTACKLHSVGELVKIHREYESCGGSGTRLKRPGGLRAANRTDGTSIFIRWISFQYYSTIPGHGLSRSDTVTTYQYPLLISFGSENIRCHKDLFTTKVQCRCRAMAIGRKRCDFTQRQCSVPK